MLRFQAVLASPNGHKSSDILSSFDDAVDWIYGAIEQENAFIYGLVGYRIVEVYVLTKYGWRSISC